MARQFAFAAVLIAFFCSIAFAADSGSPYQPISGLVARSFGKTERRQSEASKKSILIWLRFPIQSLTHLMNG